MDTVKIRLLLPAAALAVAFAPAALAAPPPSRVPVTPRAPATVQPANAKPAATGVSEEGLSDAIRALPAATRAQLRTSIRQAAVATDEQRVTGALRPNTFAAMRAHRARPRDTAIADPAIPHRFLQNLDAICRTMPAAARRNAGLTDAECTQVHAGAAAAAR